MIFRGPLVIKLGTSGRRRAIVGAATALVMCMSLAAQAHECIPTFHPQAEFGQRDLATNATCPNDPNAETCAIVDDGVTYDVTDGLVIQKEIGLNAYVASLPFGVAWHDKLDVVVRKVDAVAKGKPPLFLISEGDTFFLSTDTCLRTKGGADYDMTMFFDDKQRLIRMLARVNYP